MYLLQKLVIISHILLTSVAIFVETEPTSNKCGYQSCTPLKKKMLNVHLIPHSHDDVGWVKTPEQYYFEDVQFIIKTIIASLLKNPDRRFVQVETYYLWKFVQYNNAALDELRHLIDNGQLEIAGGAWAMNDEAVTHYQSIIDQFTWGLRKLNDTFGPCARPRVGWQIDPFGHSREMASLFAQMGFDGTFFTRVDYQDKQMRFETRTAEMIWKGNPILGDQCNLFTSILKEHYSAPRGFNFEGDQKFVPIIDDPTDPNYNVDSRVQIFLKHVEYVAYGYLTNNVAITMGDDFAYKNAENWFINMDTLIRHVNKEQERGSNINLIYSTPSCYIKAVHDANLSWPVKFDDFFPYASDEHSYWTGFYTSRPTLKYYERRSNNLLQVCKQLAAITGDYSSRIDTLRENMGIMQHHDAITGTEKNYVAENYVEELTKACVECEKIAEEAVRNIIMSKIQSDSDEIKALKFETCPLLNHSECATSEYNKKFIVVVYNPLGHIISKYIRLPIPKYVYSVRDSSGEKQKVQIVPISQRIQHLYGRNSSAKVELVFLARELPPLGFRSYYVKRTKHSYFPNPIKKRDLQIRGDNIIVKFAKKTGKMCKISFGSDDIEVNHEFRYYKSEWLGRPSGAYVFRPRGSSYPFKRETKTVIRAIYKGPLVEEVHQEYNKLISLITRVYKEEDHVEMDWIVGPLDLNFINGTEVVSILSTNVKNADTFFTDSNGNQMLQRKRNKRSTWDVELNEPISGNYYPVTSQLLIKDNYKRLSILTDRSQGGTSLKEGEMELMVQRRLIYDDGFGVDEALFQTGIETRGKHYIIGGSNQAKMKLLVKAKEQELKIRKLLQPWMIFLPTGRLPFMSLKSKLRLDFRGIKNNLPNNLHILTCEPWRDDHILLRLENISKRNCETNNLIVNLELLFTTLTIISVRETTLAANQWLGENSRLNWTARQNFEDLYLHDISNIVDEKLVRDKKNTDHQLKPSSKKYSTLARQYAKRRGRFYIQLQPMEIRSFIIEVN